MKKLENIMPKQIIIKIIMSLDHILSQDIYSQDIGMEYGIEKCALLVMKSGKRHLTDGKELPNQDKIRTIAENETNKYLGILEADTIKQVEMKNKIQKEYLIRKTTRDKALLQKPYQRNKYLDYTPR